MIGKGRTRTVLRSRVIGFAIALLVVLAGNIVSPLPVQAQTPRDVASGRVIVTLEPGANPRAVADRAIRQSNVEVRQVYNTAIRGFAATLSPAAAEALARDPSVRSITPDYPVHAVAQTLPTGVDRIDADKNSTAAINGVDTPVNADIAILDSGITSHPDLNVVGGKDCTGTGSYADDNGHGTHVAGTAAAKDNSIGVVGVAPGARLWAIKVLGANGSGSYSTLICGVDWVTQNAGTVGVANLSLAGTAPSSTCTADLLSTDPFHQAICRSVSAGVTYTVAAGNSSADASNYVPASFSEVITVSAVNDSDGKPGGDSFASFSNYGSVVDIAAPGVGILSTLNTGGYGKFSGTSMASPHVAGAVALVIAAQGRIGPAAIKSVLLSSREQTALSGDPDGISEGILAVGNGYSPTAPTPTPTATPTPSSGTTGGKLPIVSATRSSGSTLPTYAYDNNTTTSWYTTTSTVPTAAFLTLDTGAVRSLSSIRWQFRISGYADRMYIQVSSNGTSWSTLATRTNATAGTWQSLSTTASARYVRFYFTNPNKDARLGYLAEVEIYGGGTTATSPTPTPTPTATATPTATPSSGTTTGKLPIVGSTRSSGSTLPTYAYDNNTTTSWYTTTSTVPTAAFLTLDTGAVRSLSSIRWQFRISGYADRMYIQVSSNGTSWSTLAVRGNATAGTWQSLSTTASARYVRFYFTNPNKDARLGFLAEAEIYGSGASVSGSGVDATATPMATATQTPTQQPSATPTATSSPTVEPTATPTEEPTATSTEEPTASPTESPTAIPTETATAESTAVGTGEEFGTATVTNTGGAGANCRIEMSVDAAIIALLPEGTVVELTGPSQGEWQPVICEGQAGYIGIAFLEPTDGETLVEPTATPAIDLAEEPVLSEPAGAPGVTPTPTPDGPLPFVIVASGQTENAGSSRLVWDEDPTTYWVTLTGVPEEVASFTLDLGTVLPVGEIRWVYTVGDLGEGLSIQLSEDGLNWETVEKPGGAPVGVWQEETVNAAARFIRFQFTNPYGTAYLGGIGEVEILPATVPVRALILDPPTPEPTVEPLEPTAIAEDDPVVEAGAETAPPTEETIPPAEQTPPGNESEGLR